MLFSRDAKKDQEPKRRSTLGILFNPDIGSSIRPLGESITMFVRLIAMIFAANKLFPADHPALQRGSNAPLTMHEIITTAWRGLSFTRQGLPQVILFFAVVGCLVFSALFVITVLLSLFVGSAHAAPATGASTGMFDPPGKKCDLAYRWIDYLFLKGDINGSGSCNGDMPVPSGTAIQNVLSSALSFYSNGILVFAGIILMYHLVSMVVETAHHGTPMGKRASQIWAPIRLVVAIGLLVPVSTMGLNTGQYIVIQMAKWGSGLAGQTWELLINGITNADYGLKQPTSPRIAEVALKLVQIDACMTAYNAILEGSYGTSGVNIEPYKVKMSNPPDTCAQSVCEYKFGNTGNETLCGKITMTNEPSNNSSAGVEKIVFDLYLAHDRALKKVLDPSTGATVGDGSIVHRVGKGVFGFINESYIPSNLTKPYGEPPSTVVDEYQKTLDGFIKDAAGMDATWKAAFEKIQSDWAGQGWVTAGAWFNTIARAQGAVLNGAEGPVPIVEVPTLEGERVGYSKHAWETIKSSFGLGMASDQLDNVYDSTRRALASYNEDIIARTRENTPDNLAATGLPYKGSETSDGAGIKAFMWALNGLGEWLGVWPKDDKMIFHFQKTANPLAELSFLGYKNVSFGLNIIGYAGIGSLTSSALGLFGMGSTSGLASGALKGLQEAGGALITLAMLLGVIFITAGIAMAFILPLLPFIKFFFGVLTWFLSLFEAVVSVPLWALAHVTPYGEGLPGDMARQGYFFLLSIFLRPVLMIFGLIAGLLLFFVAINFLNMTYNVAVAGSGVSGGTLATMSKIVMSIIYATLAYTCANSCFKAIHFFPEHALSWMNTRGVTAKDMGDPQAIAGTMQLATAYFGEKAASQLGQMGGGLSRVGQASQDAGQRKQTLADRRQAADDAAQQGALQEKRHQELINALQSGGGGNSANLPGSDSGTVIIGPPPPPPPNEPHHKSSPGGIQIPLTKEDRRRDPIESREDFSGTNTDRSSNIIASSNVNAAKRERDKT